MLGCQVDSHETRGFFKVRYNGKARGMCNITICLIGQALFLDLSNEEITIQVLYLSLL